VTAVVIDNSALIEVAAMKRPDPGLVKRFLGSEPVAPELIDAEALNVIRRLVLSKVLTVNGATKALTKVKESPIARISHRPLLDRAWKFRNTVSGYDALYLALAEELDIPLLTCDAKLAATEGHDVTIELFERS
jgi:predicted nucleic acid-binding protein